MSYRVSSIELQRYPLQQQDWVRQKLPDDIGVCHTDSVPIRTDFSLLKTSYCPLKDLMEITRKQFEEPVLAITFGLQGQSLFKGKGGKELSFRQGYTTVSTFSASDGVRQYHSQSQVDQLRLIIGEDSLRYYLGGSGYGQLLKGRTGIEQLIYQPTTQASQVHAKALLWLTGEQNPDVLQIHIHALSLLAEQLRTLGFQIEKQTPKLCQRDVCRLNEARKILEEHISGSLTVKDLAVAVGMNESKLRKGFHYYFNTSPHRYLLELRMQRARQLLEGGCQVAEAAYAVGYEHPSNFSAAFTRFFKCAPKTVFGPKI